MSYRLISQVSALRSASASNLRTFKRSRLDEHSRDYYYPHAHGNTRLDRNNRNVNKDYTGTQTSVGAGCRAPIRDCRRRTSLRRRNGCLRCKRHVSQRPNSSGGGGGGSSLISMVIETARALFADAHGSSSLSLQSCGFYAKTNALRAVRHLIYSP